MSEKKEWVSGKDLFSLEMPHSFGLLLPFEHMNTCIGTLTHTSFKKVSFTIVFHISLPGERYRKEIPKIWCFLEPCY